MTFRPDQPLCRTFAKRLGVGTWRSDNQIDVLWLSVSNFRDRLPLDDSKKFAVGEPLSLVHRTLRIEFQTFRQIINHLSQQIAIRAESKPSYRQLLRRTT